MLLSTRQGAQLKSARLPMCPYLTVRKKPRALILKAKFGGGRSGAVIDKPSGFDVSKTAGWDSGKDLSFTTTLPKLDSGEGGANRDRSSSAGGGGWRVLLMNYEKHDEKTVVKAITRVVPNTDENHAKNCFHTSKQLGLAIITTCLKEHAEHYRDQLYSYGCRTAIEPEISAA